MYFILSRNTPKLLIVILLPAFCLAILSTCGLVIPIGSGEKLGYSVTVLLAFYVYKEAVENMMAPWENYDETPTLVGLFTVITMSKFCIVGGKFLCVKNNPGYSTVEFLLNI